MSGHYEVDGDDSRPLNCCLPYPDVIADDSEEVGEVISKLPLAPFDPYKHFVAPECTQVSPGALLASI